MPAEPVVSALVTGVTGQDGWYLAHLLRDAGVAVHGLVREPPSAAAPEFVCQHRGDLCDRSALVDLVVGLAPRWVVNLGGLSSVARSWQEPELTRRACYEAVVALLDAVRMLAAQGHETTFLQASSAEMFGHPADGVPPTEETQLRPVSPYGSAKAAAHEAVLRARSEGLDARTAILFPHESPRRREGFVSRQICAGVVAVANGTAPALLLGNPAAARDWGWAPDYVDAIDRILTAPAPGDFVVATGKAHTVAEFARLAYAAVGVPQGEIRTDPALGRPQDVAVIVGDATKLRNALGWAPTLDFPTMVQELVRAELDRVGALGR